jgi:hypothetical protein
MQQSFLGASFFHFHPVVQAARSMADRNRPMPPEFTTPKMGFGVHSVKRAADHGGRVTFV